MQTAMLSAGRPSSQRKQFGAENDTCPVDVSGAVSDCNVRVSVRSADHVWSWDWAVNQDCTGEDSGVDGALAAIVSMAKAKRMTQNAIGANLRRRKRGDLRVDAKVKYTGFILITLCRLKLWSSHLEPPDR